MQPFNDCPEADFSCLFVSNSPELHTAIDRALPGLHIKHERDASAALRNAEEQNVPIVVAAHDVGWQRMLEECSRMRNAPSVVVLMPTGDPLTWAEALSRGAVDALSVTSDHNRLVWTLRAAYRRWERRQLVRAALDQNPMMRGA